MALVTVIGASYDVFAVTVDGAHAKTSNAALYNAAVSGASYNSSNSTIEGAAGSSVSEDVAAVSTVDRNIYPFLNNDNITPVSFVTMPGMAAGASTSIAGVQNSLAQGDTISATGRVGAHGEGSTHNISVGGSLTFLGGMPHRPLHDGSGMNSGSTVTAGNATIFAGSGGYVPMQRDVSGLLHPVQQQGVGKVLHNASSVHRAFDFWTGDRSSASGGAHSDYGLSDTLHGGQLSANPDSAAALDFINSNNAPHAVMDFGKAAGHGNAQKMMPHGISHTAFDHATPGSDGGTMKLDDGTQITFTDDDLNKLNKPGGFFS